MRDGSLDVSAVDSMHPASSPPPISPTALSAFSSCAHLAQLERRVRAGELKRPVFDDPHADLLRRKGEEHEAAYLERLKETGRSILTIPHHIGDPEGVRQTEEAIRTGTYDVVYQAHLVHGGWRGIADFLERQPNGSYEPVETKLARATRPEHLLQLCFYAEQLERIQGVRPEFVHVELGSGQRETFRTAEYAAYYRHVRDRFLAALAEPPATYPWPCDHCGVCSWRRECHSKLVADDNLMLVAGLARSQADALADARITTLEQLAKASCETEVEDVRPETFKKLHHQAELQLYHRRTGEYRFELLPPDDGRGFSLLPEPSPGDVWFDFEGYPFFEPARGLEYLFGFCYHAESGELRYENLWAKDSDSERQAFEQLVDWIVQRRRLFPGMHVYHYADHERSTLRRLMGEHGTREEAIDDFLRNDVLVDLCRVVKQSLRASVESYSLKAIEALYGFKRTSDVMGGSESSVQFEKWLECGDDSLLEEVALYNEEDCRSTAALHEWLLSQRTPDLPWRQPPEQTEKDDETETADEDRERVKAELLARSRGEGDTWWLLAQLIDYHRREAKPQYWEWFNHLSLDDDELIDDTHTIGGLELVGDPVPDKRSFVYTLSFPDQDHKIGTSAVDPATESRYKVTVDDDRREVTLRRGKDRSSEPLPRALIPDPPIPNHSQRDAILRFARSCLAGDGSYPALAGILERSLPRVDLSGAPPEAAITLDRSYLIVQGPPGAGKTWQGARTAIALMKQGRRVGITALSHKAINNLLVAIETEASRQGFSFRGLKKFTEEEDAHRGPFVDSSDKNDDLLNPKLQLIAGTAWLFSREEFHQTVDTLIIDEAGQVALADAIASGTAADNVILLGDPNQLPQVSQGAQPEAARASVLQHLLGENEVVPSELGLFLAETWRLRPELCAFTSEAYYKGRLKAADVCAKRSLASGNGLAVVLVEHEGCSQASRQEAEVVAREIERLIGTEFTNENGVARPLTPSDFLVVAPYNAQVRTLRSRLPADVRVGTVDKFQGQEAPVVLVSFASSTGADAPRGIGFAFERHRVNVATSRGQCRVVLVCSPRLLEAECRSVEQMRLMNAVCRFDELAAH
jgi:uncharacterized protein